MSYVSCLMSNVDVVQAGLNILGKSNLSGYIVAVVETAVDLDIKLQLIPCECDVCASDTTLSCLHSA